MQLFDNAMLNASPLSSTMITVLQLECFHLSATCQLSPWPTYTRVHLSYTYSSYMLIRGRSAEIAQRRSRRNALHRVLRGKGHHRVNSILAGQHETIQTAACPFESSSQTTSYTCIQTLQRIHWQLAAAAVATLMMFVGQRVPT